MTPPIVAVTGLNRGENPQPGYAVVRSLRRRFPDLTVIGLVYDALESGIFANDGPDWAYTIPYPTAGSRALLERLDFVLARHPVGVLIPTLDAEIEPLIRVQPELAARGVRALLPTAEAFRARAKVALHELCAACGCTTPPGELVSDAAGAARAAARVGFPAMIKGQYYDARKVADEAEAAAAFREVVSVWGVPALVQKCITGGEYNVMGVGDGRGGVTGLCAVRKTVLSSRGKGVGAVVLREPRLEQITARIVAHLRWLGPFELELIRDDAADVFHIIEMNPRFPAWVDFPSALGLNFPAQVVALLTSRPIDPAPEVPAGRFYLRHQVELIGSMADLAPLATDGVWTSHRNRR